MKRKSMIGLLGGVGVVSLVAGYFLRDSTQSVSAQDWQGSPPRKEAAHSGGRAKAAQTSHVGHVKRALERSEGVLYWFHLVAGVEEAPLDELARFALFAKGNEVALQLIAEHWLERDPRHLFETLVELSRDQEANQEGFPFSELRDYLFDYWVKVDLEAAIAALSHSDGVPGQHAVRHNVAMEVMKTDPKRGLEVMKQWGIVSWIPPMGALRDLAKRDPRAAAAAVFDNATTSIGFQQAVQAVADVWGKSDPAAALRYMSSQNSHLGQMAQEKIMKTWALRDFNAASDWLESQADYSLQSRLTPRLVEAWAEEDPQAALVWCQEHLDGSLLSKSVGLLARGAANKDLKSTATLVAGLKPSSGRTQAGIEVAKVWFPQSVPSDRKVAPEAVDWLRNLDDREMQGKILEEIGWAWGKHDRDGLISFLSESHATQASDQVFERVARDLAEHDLKEAFQWAATLPEKRSANVTGAVFRSWLRNQPEAAGNWLQDISATDIRRAPLVESFIEDSLFGQEDVLLRRLDSLKSGDGPVVRTALKRARISEEKKQRALRRIKD